MNKATLRFCKDCVHYREYDPYPEEDSKCYHTVEYNLVTGAVVAPTCASNRGIALRCGPDARFFEENS